MLPRKIEHFPCIKSESNLNLSFNKFTKLYRVVLIYLTLGEKCDISSFKFIFVFFFRYGNKYNYVYFIYFICLRYYICLFYVKILHLFIYCSNLRLIHFISLKNKFRISFPIDFDFISLWKDQKQGIKKAWDQRSRFIPSNGYIRSIHIKYANDRIKQNLFLSSSWRAMRKIRSRIYVYLSRLRRDCDVVGRDSSPRVSNFCRLHSVK